MANEKSAGAGPAAANQFQDYPRVEAYDELLTETGQPRPSAEALVNFLGGLSDAELASYRDSVNAAIKAMGISFTVYSDNQNIDRAWPLDIVPRIIPAPEWRQTEAGLKQRLKALNLFINDIYNRQEIIRDGEFPQALLTESTNFLPPCRGITPPHGVWAHICGSDLVRDRDGTLYVLEDNLRVPSGVSYMLENRRVMKRVFPQLFQHNDIQPVTEYTYQLRQTLASLSPQPGQEPVIVVLTPGIYNSAYFEHSYLAQEMGAFLVEGSDLVAGKDHCIYMKTISGLRRVDVIYRRIDSAFLDPEVFREDSALGVPGLINAWRRGNVAIANAPGSGMADDKVVYALVPKIIRYYLGEEPLLKNVPSYLCMYDEDREYVLDNLDKLVVKPANESGGYGLMIGPHATPAERARCAERIRANPRNYMAQPTLSISTAPTLCEGRIEPRHVDLRPFVLQGREFFCTTGGLCRVALRKGSLVVNSSQGGGSKDTWILNHR